MTEHSDLILSVTQSDGNTTRTYSAYRIDYDSSLTLAEVADVDDLDGHYSGQVKPVSQTAIDRGYHTPKDNYKRLVLVEDATTRDEVQNDLDAEGVAYTTEDVSPTTQEKTIIEREEASNINEIEQALTQQNDLVERRLVSQATKDNAATAIQNVSDADAQTALEQLYEVLTGETPSETLN
jgi:hypothetical protein